MKSAPILLKAANILGISTLFIAGLASASTVTYVSQTDFVGTYGTNGANDCRTSYNVDANCYRDTAWASNGSATVAIQGFDTSLGTLTKVSLTATAYAYGEYRIRNTSGDTATFDTFSSSIVDVIVKTGTQTPYLSTVFPASGLVSENVWTTLRMPLFNLSGSLEAGYDVTTPFGSLANPLSQTKTVNLCSANEANADGDCKTASNGEGFSQPLSQFYGSGMINLPVYANASTSLINLTTGNAAASTTTHSLIVVESVTYTYDAVPEPGTWGLMLLGVFGLGVAQRRFAKQRAAK